MRQPAPILALLAVAAAATLGPAHADEYVKWGTLPTSSGRPIYQWEVAQWMARYFNDGNRLDKRIDIATTSFFTQCYGGDWLSSFNGTPGQSVIGASYDRWSFTNAVSYSANKAGELSYYSGYHAGASAAYGLAVGLGFSLMAHGGGVSGRDAREVPQLEGAVSTPFMSGKTFIFGYAGQAESLDYVDLDRIGQAVAGRNDVVYDRFTPLDFAPSAAELELSLKIRGNDMQPGDSVHFFVTDHGGFSSGWINDLVLPSDKWKNLAIPFTPGMLQGTQGQAEGWLELASRTPFDLSALRNMSIRLNGVQLDAAKLVSGDVIDGPEDDDVKYHTFRLRLPGGIFNDRNPQGDEFLQLLTLDDRTTGQALSFDWVMLDSGPVLKPIGAPIPEPGTYALMLAGLGLVGALTRRRTPRH
jgi:hypothetical protein